ncbi:helix-turn-helix domain-containing protein [Brevundimonas nasdae]|uniref:helix-turn-helix domain-containing protein n=1 Tax=Brevundimonas nasdae TaxID=172043 RepID=UPI0028A148FE|nr:helix-turn-helix transcriptional regulator [Brevundimonas nasdae]
MSDSDHDPVDVHVGSRVREERVRANKTQVQLGAHLGVTFQQVQKYERGVNRISAATLHRIAELFEVPMASFFAENPGEAPASPTISTVRGGEQLVTSFLKLTPERQAILVSLAKELANEPT